MRIDEYGTLGENAYVKLDNELGFFKKLMGFPKYTYFFRYQGVWFKDCPVGGEYVTNPKVVNQLNRLMGLMERGG